MLTAEQIVEKLDDHDARVTEGKAEIRMLGSYDSDGHGEFVVFIIVVDSEIVHLTADEDEAIDYYMEHR